MKCTATLIAALTSVSASSIAADFPPRVAIGAQSSYLGVETPDLALYRRQTGPGALAVSSQLLGQFGSRPHDAKAVVGSGKYTTTQEPDALRFEGDDGWTLKVFRDGTAAEYRNRKYRLAHRKAVPVEQQPTLATLASWGRNFISANLAGVVTLGPNEALVESHALFERRKVVKRDSVKPATTTTAGAIVVFTRTINGMPIVGEGSKVEISFTVDGVPWAFDYDWPSYSTTAARQQVLPLSEIRQRQSRLLPVPANVARQTETRFECGYFDMGVKHRSSTSPLIQGGCISQHEFNIVGDPERYAADPTDGLLTSARAVSIPAGAEVEPDDDWPEAKTIRGEGQSMKAKSAVPGSNQTRGAYPATH